MKYKYSYTKGFTLLEVLIVIGILAVLSAAVLVAVNPTRQFKIARDTQRLANVNAIANAISQNMADNKGSLICAGILLDLSIQIKTISSSDVDLAKCLVPEYIASIPFDSGIREAHYTGPGDYISGYSIQKDPDTGRIVISATGELDENIKAIR